MVAVARQVLDGQAVEARARWLRPAIALVPPVDGGSGAGADAPVVGCFGGRRRPRIVTPGRGRRPVAAA
ncbi:hypothetical protein I6I18_10470 [Kytococcus sedentarius]|nr:hypothetical protein [Kytococcus sedentarius]QQB63451.1 hypothetical protein I6I18_10470 [Kytococcus sedentarius]STX13635.1 Uncharacterised protein [Kytococcus sedentarius]